MSTQPHSAGKDAEPRAALAQGSENQQGTDQSKTAGGPAGRRRKPSLRERGVAILVVVVTTAIIGATAADFAYTAQIELEAAINSRDQLRAEYLARSGMQLGQLLTAVQDGLQGMLQMLPPEMRDAIVITDYAGFLAKALSGDAEAREGLGGLVGIDLKNVEGLGTPQGTNLDLVITSEEGKYPINCGSGVNPYAQPQRNLYYLLYNLIRPQRYDRMFNTVDRDGIQITREDLPTAIIDWTDVDPLRFNPMGPASASEERYDRGSDRYEAHNHYLDTIEELNLVRGVSEDFWGAFGEMFTAYGGSSAGNGTDCRVLASAIEATSWPLVAAMIAASAADRNAVFDPNTAIVAQQVTGLLKTGLPALRTLSGQLSIPKCQVDTKQCPTVTSPPPSTPAPRIVPSARPGAPPGGGGTTASDAVELLSNLICSQALSQVPQLADSLASMTGGSAPPKPTTGLRSIPMCPGALAQYLRDRGSGTGNPRRYYRVDSTGIVQRGASRTTQVHIRGVWDTRRANFNPLCTGHPSCTRGTWLYYRID